MHANQKYGKVSIICKFDNLFNFEMLYMLYVVNDSKFCLCKFYYFFLFQFLNV